MSPFQIIVLPLVTVLFIRSVVRLGRGDGARGLSVASAVIWLLAGLAIFKPDLTMEASAILGIGRGADLLLYIVATLFIVSFFYFYGKIRMISSDLTTIVRHLALLNAQSPPRSPEGRRPAEPDAGE